MRIRLETLCGCSKEADEDDAEWPVFHVVEKFATKDGLGERVFRYHKVKSEATGIPVFVEMTTVFPPRRRKELAHDC